jgi:hypothetical protein
MDSTTHFTYFLYSAYCCSYVHLHDNADLTTYFMYIFPLFSIQFCCSYPGITLQTQLHTLHRFTYWTSKDWRLNDRTSNDRTSKVSTSNDWMSKIPNVEEDTTSNMIKCRKTKHRKYSTSKSTQRQKTEHWIWTLNDWTSKNSTSSYYDIIIQFEVAPFKVVSWWVHSRSKLGHLLSKFSHTKFGRSKFGHSNDPTYYDWTS